VPSVICRVKHVRGPEEISALLVQEAGNWRLANAIPNVRKGSLSRTLVVRNVITIAVHARVSYNWSIAVDRLNLRFLVFNEKPFIPTRRRSARMYFLSTSLDVGRWIMYGVLRSSILRFLDAALQELSF